MKTPTDFLAFLEHSLAAVARDQVSDEEKVLRVYRLTRALFIEAGEDEPLHFTTLFARIAHSATRFRIPGRLIWLLQRFRIDAENLIRKGTLEPDRKMQDVWLLGAHALHATAPRILGVEATCSSDELIGFPPPQIPGRTKDKTTFKRQARLVAHSADTENALLHAYDADSPEAKVCLRYGETGRSELFKENVEKAIQLIGFPLSLSAIDIEIDRDGIYSPRILVVEPDYLIDISTIAECYQDTGGDVRLYMPKKFQESKTTVALLTGKVANFFLDQLMHKPDTPFDELFPRVFFLNPTEFSTLTDEEVWHMMKDCESHYQNLRHVITAEFPKLGLDRNKMFIEPAFFSPVYGIQGRLDLFQSEPESKQIIELKSGQPFRANTYGLSSSHYAQTLLYDLMIKSVYDFQPKQTCYILYSRLNQQALKYAPPVEAIQREVIRLRNDILLAEREIATMKVAEHGVFDTITTERIPEVTGFLRQEIADFGDAWSGLDGTEQRYIRIFSRFVAREHYYAKVGVHGADQVNGLASLWLDTDLEKEERFAIFPNLTVQEVIQESPGRSDSDASVVLRQETAEPSLVNFRIGDIAVLYPMRDDAPGVLRSQIYKCTVTALGNRKITVRLRSRQVSYEDIRSHARWALEHDLYDRSFNVMHGALFKLARFAAGRRALFLGRTSPAMPDQGKHLSGLPLDGRQRSILEKIILAKDYFLLWGPPGTGKTSVILHHLVKYHLLQTSDRLVLLAYTNRAVDEICEALDAIGDGIRDTYVRIGSHVGTGERYAGQLLGNRIAGMSRRKEVVEYIRSQRIIVGTISSIAGKPEIFKLFNPGVCIVDEASQILEPVLAGLLPAFRKWVLIGDHHQLPAVVAQPPAETRLQTDAIPEIALDDTRDSYFERMYHLCAREGWDWAYGNLTEQGRMHQALMDLPGRMFYDSQLELLQPAYRKDRDYTGPIRTPHKPSFPVARMLAMHRLLWFPSRANPELRYTKTHDEEALIVVEIVRQLQGLYGKVPDLGIITPFRAQIANIRAALRKHEFDPGAMTIDTVERYQGSARDIVLLSLSIHHSDQLRQVISLSRENVDRKLNVALTRAREQFILVAAREVVETSHAYRELSRACQTVESLSYHEDMA